MEKTNGGIVFGDALNTDEIIFAPKAQKIQIPICDKTVTTEISEDFTLPDYLPEIRRLLRITPSVTPPSRYIGNDIAEFSGNVGWSVLYVGGDGSLSNAQLSSAYEAAAEFDGDVELDPDSRFEAVDEITPESIVGRVTAPRKLNIRCRLRHRIRAFGERAVEPQIYGDCSADSIKKLTATLPACRMVYATDDSLELQDSFPLMENTKIIATHGEVIINDTKCEDGEIVCKGFVNVTVLSSVGEGELITAERKIPFTANPIAELDGDGWSCRAHGVITHLSPEITDSDVTLRLNVCTVCEAQKNLLTQFTTDIFSTESECDPTREIISVPCALICDSFSIGHDGSAAIEGLPEGASVVDTHCAAEADTVTLENGKYILQGKCRYNVLYKGNNEYSARESEFPFKCELCDGNIEPTDFSADLTVMSCKVKPEGENMAYSAEITAAVRMWASSEVEAICESNFGPEISGRTAAFTVAYPSSSDTLWEVAKRYSVDPVELAAANGIRYKSLSDTTSLDGVKYLIV